MKNALMKFEMADIIYIGNVDGRKFVNRWGFFADQGDGTCAIYKPENNICDTDKFFEEMLAEKEPGAIQVVADEEIEHFFEDIKDDIKEITSMEVSETTPCGWYYALV